MPFSTALVRKGPKAEAPLWQIRPMGPVRPPAPLEEALAISGKTGHRAIVLPLRGRAYQRLGLQERSIKDFDEAILINPQHALAFFYRGLALAALGRDLEANQDVLQLERLGSTTVDVAVLREVIAAVKRSR